jgi:hypothetical protein
MIEGEITVWVRRQWNDYRQAKVLLDNLENLHWDTMSGGVYAPTPRPFIHGYMRCDQILSGEIAHSCLHGEGPHRIKVCLTKSSNKKNWSHILGRVSQDGQQA